MSVDSLMTAICGIDPTSAIGLEVAKPSRRSTLDGDLGHHAPYLNAVQGCVNWLTVTAKVSSDQPNDELHKAVLRHPADHASNIAELAFRAQEQQARDLYCRRACTARRE